MSKLTAGNLGTVVLSELSNGYNVVQGGTPLKYVNYFDGMLMRAELMKVEQQGLHSLSQLSNQAGGHGVVRGFDAALRNGSIRLGSGMAIDTSGRVVFMPDEISVAIDDLIARASSTESSRAKTGVFSQGFAECIENTAPDPVTVIEGTQYYVITVGQIDALCGEEDVYGRLCEEACITSTDRPLRIDGVVVRAEPLPAGLDLPQSSEVTLGGTHLRSRIASAFFDFEQELIASQISAAGLGRGLWCNGGRLPGSYTRGVPVALLARSGSENLFLDRWIVTRERMEAPPRRYWAHVMAMRPWNIFLAQVLQFQCQLNQLFGPNGGGSAEDPCADTKAEMRAMSDELQQLLTRVKGSSDDAPTGLHWMLKVEEVEARLRNQSEVAATPTARMLINGGIVETPSAGYLPVQPDASLSVEAQVRNLMGEGVDLRFCRVRPDFVPHALEEAQHMDRISLLEGLDNPDAKPRVDVLVPDGVLKSDTVASDAIGYHMQVEISRAAGELLDYFLALPGAQAAVAGSQAVMRMAAATPRAFDVGTQRTATLDGVARGGDLPGGGLEFHYAGYGGGVGQDSASAKKESMMTIHDLREAQGTGSGRPLALWLSMSVDRDPTLMNIGQIAKALLELDLFEFSGKERVGRYRIDSSINLKITDQSGDETGIEATGELTISREILSGGGAMANKVPINNTVRLRRVESGLTRATLVSLLSSAALGHQFEAFVSQRLWRNETQARVKLGLSMRGKSNPSVIVINQPDQAGQLSHVLVQADQVVDADVFKANHPAHESSIKALDRMSVALGQPQLSASRAQILFDRGESSTGQAQIHATRDWVLFHRRRDKQCGSDLVDEDIAPRTYRAFVIRLKAESDLEIVRKLLQQQDWQGLARFELVPVTTVAFDAGSPNLVSARQRILSDWRLAVRDDVDIRFGAVVNHPDWEESASLAEARIRQLNDVIDDESTIAPDAEFESIASSPPALSGSDEGGMLYVLQDLAVTCQRVLRFPPNDNPQEIIARFRAILGNANSFDAALKQFNADQVGIVGFRGESADAIDNAFDPLLISWNQLGNGPVAGVMNVTRSNTDQAPSVSQAAVVAEKLGAGNPAVVHAATALPIGDCWGVTIIVPGFSEQHGVFRFDNGIVPLSGVDSVARFIERRGLTEAIAKGWVSEGTVDFGTDGATVSEEDLKRVDASISANVALPDNVEWRLISVAPKDLPAAEATTIESQSKKIAELLGTGADVGAVKNPEAELPDNLGGASLLIPTHTTVNHTTIPITFAAAGEPITAATPQVAFRFDEDNDLIRDEFFEKQLEQLKRHEMSFGELEFAGERKPRNNDKRLNAVVEVLKESGVMKSDARKKTAKVAAAEHRALDFGTFTVPEVMVLRR